MHRVIVITADSERYPRRPYSAATAGFPVNFRRARLSTARADAKAIAMQWRSRGDTTEIRDFTVGRNPTLERQRVQLAYMQGRRAFNTGRAVSDCPYVRGSAIAQAWADGWRDALRRSNPTGRKKKRPTGGDWQPDLFGGRGVEREGTTRAEQLELARDEMRRTASSDLFDFLAEKERNPG